MRIEPLNEATAHFALHAGEIEAELTYGGLRRTRLRPRPRGRIVAEAGRTEQHVSFTIMSQDIDAAFPCGLVCVVLCLVQLSV